MTWMFGALGPFPIPVAACVLCGDAPPRCARDEQPGYITCGEPAIGLEPMTC
jgi:hypothetical protein